MQKIPVQVKRFAPDLPLPAYQSTDAAGFDLASSADASFPPHQVTLVHTGVALAFPPNFWLLVAARSSLHQLGLQLANGVGVVDADYCGDHDEIRLLLYNFSDHIVDIKKGDRLAQAILVPRVQAHFEPVAHLTNPDRGGLGSTGR